MNKIFALAALGCVLLGGPAAAIAGDSATLTFSLYIPERDAAAWRDLAVANIASGHDANAAMAYRRVLESDPKDAVALRFLGDHALKAGDGASARIYYERLLVVLDPQTDEAVRLRGMLAGQ